MAAICFLAGLALGFAQPHAPKADPIPDIGVCYVSRTPRYDRYVVTNDTGGPLLWHGGAKNPIGQNITYTAKIRNHGDGAESFGYTISLDGVVLKSGTGTLQPYQSGTVSVSAPNKGVRQNLTVTVTPDLPKVDPAINNSLTIATDAYAIRFVADPYVYLYYLYWAGKQVSPYGTFAFEDWAQKQVEALNLLMANRGVDLRVFLDTIEVSPNLLYSRSYPDSTGHDATFVAYLAYLNPVNGLQNYYDELTVELLGRYIGLAYDAFYSIGEADNPVSHLNYFPPASILAYGGTNAPWLSEYDATALNVTKQYRRGFIGEYQYDIPETLSVKILDAQGAAMPNYKVDVYQTVTTGGLTTAPIFTGRTDGNGILTLPNVAVSRRDTPTGHHLKPNPFGQVDQYGRNGLLHFRVYTPVRYVFGWLPLSRVNRAFWNGSTKKATLPVVAYRYPTAIGSIPSAPEYTVKKGTPISGNFTITTGVIKAQVTASVVQGQDFIKLSKTDGTSPLRIKYDIDTTKLDPGEYYFVIDLHDWSQGTDDYYLNIHVIVQ
jgi:hypothetical protein